MAHSSNHVGHLERKLKVSDLLGAELDRHVAKAQGKLEAPDFSPSSDWAQGGPIIDREGIQVAPMPAKGGAWCAVSIGRLPNRVGSANGAWMEGPTPLIAAMRAYVRARFGPEVE